MNITGSSAQGIKTVLRVTDSDANVLGLLPDRRAG
jgi:hypothetical protein